MNDLLKRFGFAPVGFQILPLGNRHSSLTAADQSMFWSFFDRITVADIGGGIQHGAVISDVNVRIQLLRMLLPHPPLTPIITRHQDNRLMYDKN